jgi:hypothetical protein
LEKELIFLAEKNEKSNFDLDNQIKQEEANMKWYFIILAF